MQFLRFWFNWAKGRLAYPSNTGISATLHLALFCPTIISYGHANDDVKNTEMLAPSSRDDSQPHISVELISKTSSFNEDGSLTVGVKFTPDEHWHIYWVNPGDTGLSPEIIWKLPSGYTASALAWPYPTSFPIAHLTNYGYENTVLLSTTIKADENVDKSKPIHIEADLSWLVCEEACIPGESSLSLPIEWNTKRVGSNALATETNLSELATFFNLWNNRIPKISKSIGSKVDIDKKQKTLGLNLYAQALLFKEVKSVEVFVKNLDIVRYGKPLKIDWGNNWLKWEQELSEYYSQPPESLDIVVVIDNKDSYEFLLSI